MARRQSHSFSIHRQPPWARTPVSYDTYIRNHDIKLRERSTGDFGEDNFSYDNTHVSHAQISAVMPGKLSPQLLEVCQNFTLAQAAFDTGIERIEVLNNEAPRRTNPRVTHSHLLSRSSSNTSHISTSAEPGLVTSSFSVGTPSTTASTPAYPATCYTLPPMDSTPHVPVDMCGLESPPFTPIDSHVSITPFQYPKSTAPDLGFVTAELSPLSVRHQLSVSSPPTRAKNELAWESYLKTLDEEIYDLRHNAFMRLKQFRSEIKTLLKEHFIDGLITRQEELECNNWFDDKTRMYRQMVDAMEEKIKATGFVGPEPA